ncbi:uncharacterized protein LOC116934575 [Daphnia magna]|uniref:uncharacterized protein LOC116934575 n=1 Tax=Daphnia magna TaxID=35525 RepID=UPI001E1BD0BA|nr:uncharacterized protein LOC116934575 [Daphnia magna]
MARKTVNKGPRELLSEIETEMFVGQFILNKDVIEGAFDSGVPREAKTAAWESIAHVLRTSFAESKPRSVEELKKKWNNLKTAAKKDIGLYANSLKGTGGGTAFQLKPLYEKLNIHDFKKDNPCLPGEIIPGSCDSETLDEEALKSLYDQVQRGDARLQDIDFEVTDEIREAHNSSPVPTTPFPLAICDVRSSVLPIAAVPVIPSKSAITSYSATPSGSATPSSSATHSRPSSSAPFDGSVKNSRKRSSTTQFSMGQQVKNAKLNVCSSSETSANYRVKEQLLKMLVFIMQARRELGEPYDKSELPSDLHDLIFNSKDKL